MSRIEWGRPEDLRYSHGLDKGVLYLNGLSGIPWHGLNQVAEETTSSGPRAHYIDGIKYANLSSREDFSATIRSYGAPKQFSPCLGIRQVKSGLFLTGEPYETFGFSFCTSVADPSPGVNPQKLHLVYNAQVSTTSREYTTASDENNPSLLEIPVSTVAPYVAGYRSTAYFTVDERRTSPERFSRILDILHGTDTTDARLPHPQELIDIFEMSA